MTLAMQPLLDAIERKSKQNLYFQLRPIKKEKKQSNKNFKPLYMDSLDFLNIASLPLAKKKAIENVVKWGTGSTSSRPLLAHLEENITTEEKYRKALGYDAFSMFSFTVNIHTQIFSSLIESQAQIFVDPTIYPLINTLHNSKQIHLFHTMDALETKLKESSPNQTTIISFSSDKHLKRISELALQYKALTFLDNTTSFGTTGKYNLGIASTE